MEWVYLEMWSYLILKDVTSIFYLYKVAWGDKYFFETKPTVYFRQLLYQNKQKNNLNKLTNFTKQKSIKKKIDL